MNQLNLLLSALFKLLYSRKYAQYAVYYFHYNIGTGADLIANQITG